MMKKWKDIKRKFIETVANPTRNIITPIPEVTDLNAMEDHTEWDRSDETPEYQPLIPNRSPFYPDRLSPGPKNE